MQSADPPLVSVIIVYYKRLDTIAGVLDSVLRQDYPNREVILLDNHSEDGLRQILADHKFDIRLIELQGNLGACGGRNVGIRGARGEILVFLDDDATFSTPHELTKIVEGFSSHPRYDVLAFRVADPKTGDIRLREWCHTRPWQEFKDNEFETIWFMEGGSAFRRRLFDDCGLYYEPLFYGPEGHDLGVRIVDKGYRILYYPRVEIKHWASGAGRSYSRQYYYFTRDYIWMAYKDYHLWDGLRFIVPKMLMMMYFAWRTSDYRPFLRGVWDGVVGLRQVRRDRTPISKATVRYLEEHEKWRPSLMVRLAKHRREPLI